MSATVKFVVNIAHGSNSVFARSLEQVLPVTGMQRVSDMSEAHLVFTDRPAKSLTALKSGRNVIELAWKSGDQISALGEYFGSRYCRLSDVSSFLVDIVASIAKLPVVDLSALGAISLEGLPTMDAEALAEMRVLIVDDSRKNRRTAEAQFAGADRLVVTDSYTKALQLLNGNENFSVVMTDLVMPTEEHALGEKGAAQIGTPIAAGAYVVLAAISARVPDVVLLTCGSHHDDGMIAALDYVKNFRSEDSYVSYLNGAEDLQGGKNWVDAYNRHLQSHDLVERV